jgi:hypothetical protein
MTQPAISRETWPEAMATVTECKYEFGAGRALAFGAPSSKHFRITYNYWAPNEQGEDELHTADFKSEKPVPQGTLFPITYNPETPHHHARSEDTPTTSPSRSPVFVVGVIGSIILSAAWFLILRGCH